MANVSVSNRIEPLMYLHLVVEMATLYWGNYSWVRSEGPYTLLLVCHVRDAFYASSCYWNECVSNCGICISVLFFDLFIISFHTYSYYRFIHSYEPMFSGSISGNSTSIIHLHSHRNVLKQQAIHNLRNTVWTCHFKYYYYHCSHPKFDTHQEYFSCSVWGVAFVCRNSHMKTWHWQWFMVHSSTNPRITGWGY